MVSFAWIRSRRWADNRLAAGAKEIRTAGPILVFIDRGGQFETNTDGTELVDIGAFAGDPPHDSRGQYRRLPSSLETLSALVLTDHAYDKLTGWSNVIPIVPGPRQRDRDL